MIKLFTLAFIIFSAPHIYASVLCVHVLNIMFHILICIDNMSYLIYNLSTLPYVTKPKLTILSANVKN